jgi:hypothetical protein
MKRRKKKASPRKGALAKAQSLVFKAQVEAKDRDKSSRQSDEVVSETNRLYPVTCYAECVECGREIEAKSEIPEKVLAKGYFHPDPPRCSVCEGFLCPECSGESNDNGLGNHHCKGKAAVRRSKSKRTWRKSVHISPLPVAK